MSEKNANNKSGSFDEEFSKLLENVGKPNILPAIFTEQIIDEISDDNLIHDIFQHMVEMALKEGTDIIAELIKLPIPQQIFYKTYVLEMEVSNGGLNQFYYNRGEEFAKEIPNYLKLIGTNKLAELMIKANSIFEIENKKITKDQDGTLDGFSKSYDDNPLNNCDDEFYDINLVDNLEQLQIDFIRKNKTEFVDK